jgi:hypothetical protein
MIELKAVKEQKGAPGFEMLVLLTATLLVVLCRRKMFRNKR